MQMPDSMNKYRKVYRFPLQGCVPGDWWRMKPLLQSLYYIPPYHYMECRTSKVRKGLKIQIKISLLAKIAIYVANPTLFFEVKIKALSQKDRWDNRLYPIDLISKCNSCSPTHITVIMRR